MRQNAKVCSAMQQMKNAIGWNAMKLLKMHQNAIVCTGMRMGKNYTTFGKKLHLSLFHTEQPKTDANNFSIELADLFSCGKPSKPRNEPLSATQAKAPSASTPAGPANGRRPCAKVGRCPRLPRWRVGPPGA